MQRDKIKEVYLKTVDSEIVYDGKVENVDYYNIFCRAASEECLYKYKDNNFCSFNFKYQNKDSVLIIFSIPLSNNGKKLNKHITERIMDIVRDIEQCLVKVDFTNCENNKDDKMVYLTFIKIIDEGE